MDYINFLKNILVFFSVCVILLIEDVICIFIDVIIMSMVDEV